MRDTSLLTEYTHNASFCRATACGGVFLVVEIPVLVWNDLSNTLGAYQSCSHLPFSLILNVVTWCVIIVHVTVCHADRSDWCRALYCTVGVSSSSIGELDVTQIVHVYVVLQKYFGVLSVTYCCATEDALNNNNSLSLSLSSLPQQQHSSILSTCSTAPSQSSALGTPVKPWRPATRKLSFVLLIAHLPRPIGSFIRNLGSHWLIHQGMFPAVSEGWRSPEGAFRFILVFLTTHTVHHRTCSMQL